MIDSARHYLLVVDDDPSVAEGLKVALELRGNQVLTAPDAEQAFDIIKQRHPQVIILDMDLPRMSGRDAANRISKEHPKTPMIGISAEACNKSAMLRAGVTCFLAKPLDMPFLVRLVDDLVAAAANTVLSTK